MMREENIKITRFREWLRSSRYSKHTIKSYTDSIRILLEFFPGKEPSEITNSDLIYFNNRYILKKGYSASLQNQVVSAVKLFYQKIENRNLDIDNIDRPKRVRSLPKVIAKSDIEKMLKSIPNFKHKMALTLIYSCGLRRSELINLQLRHLDSKRKTLTIINGKGQKDRVLPVSDKLMNMIIRYYKMFLPEKYLIEGQFKGEKYSESSLENIFHKYMGRVIKNHNFTLHCLRHSYATHLLEAGVSLRYIQELLGHKSSKTTEIYTWVSMQGLQNIKNPADDFDL